MSKTLAYIRTSTEKQDLNPLTHTVTYDIGVYRMSEPKRSWLIRRGSFKLSPLPTIFHNTSYAR